MALKRVERLESVPQTHARSARVRGLLRSNLVNYILLTIGALVMVAPLIWMLSTSFKLQAETITFPPRLLPKRPTVENYQEVFERLNMARLYMNTAYVAVVKTVVNVYTSTLIGYVFGKFTFRGRDVLFYLVLSTWIIP
ncbi:MAG: carbohydrate ABC transporter permease, partial [Chloroflexota bacterium]|nr:carbohydrate ABC transporter permease [Chloroflexota bacterium]